MDDFKARTATAQEVIARFCEPAKAGDSRLAWSLDALECLGFASLLAGRTWTPGDAARACQLVERARELGLMAEEDPRGV